MSVWKTVFWGFIFLNYYCIRFASADGLATDDLSFNGNENINPLPNTDLLGSTNSNSILDNSNIMPNMFLNDDDDASSANTFVSDDAESSNIIDDLTLIAAADCSSSLINTDDDNANLYSRRRGKKARRRRGQAVARGETACPNPAAPPPNIPNLSLPSLDQIVSPANRNSPPPPPPSNNPVKNAIMNNLNVKNGLIFKFFEVYYGRCLSEKWFCSSGDEKDMSLDADGAKWTLRNTVPSEWFFFFLLYPRMSYRSLRNLSLPVSLSLSPVPSNAHG